MKNKNKGNIFLLIVSLLLLIAILAAFYFYILRGNNKPSEETPKPGDSATPTEDITQLPGTTGNESLLPTPAPTSSPDTTAAPTSVIPTDAVDVRVSHSEELGQEITMGEYKIGRVSYYLPDISYEKDQSIADRIALNVKGRIEETVADYKAQCEFFSLDYDPDDPSYYTYSTSFEYYLSPGYISFKITSLTDYGIENGSDVYCLCYSLDDGELKQKDELGLDLSILAEEAIDVSLGMTYDFSNNYKDTIRTIICNSFYLENDKIVLVYNTYEIASGLSGIIEIPVSLKNL